MVETPEAARRLVRLPFEGLDLATFDIGEAPLDPLGDVGLLALDALDEAPVARLEALPHLLGGAAALRCMRLELRADRGECAVRRVLELFPELGERGRLEVSDLVDLLAVGVDSRLGLGDEHLLPLSQFRELAGERLIRALEIR